MKQLIKGWGKNAGYTVWIMSILVVKLLLMLLKCKTFPFYYWVLHVVIPCILSSSNTFPKSMKLLVHGKFVQN